MGKLFILLITSLEEVLYFFYQGRRREYLYIAAAGTYFHYKIISRNQSQADTHLLIIVY